MHHEVNQRGKKYNEALIERNSINSDGYQAHGWSSVSFNDSDSEASEALPVAQPAGTFITSWRYDILVGKRDRLLITVYGLGEYRFIKKLERRWGDMHFVLSAHPIIALIAGALILLVPRLLSYIVAIYLIITGILGLVHWLL